MNLSSQPNLLCVSRCS